VASDRLGHANATITLTVYQHAHPGMGRGGRPVRCVAEALSSRAKYHGGLASRF
jgi:hypothetical protein